MTVSGVQKGGERGGGECCVVGEPDLLVDGGGGFAGLHGEF